MKAHRTLKFQDRPLYFIADPHFFHQGVLRWGDRGDFSDTRDLAEHMIEKWNSVIKSRNDVVFVLGDFCFGTKAEHLELMDRLNGTKFLCIGNHDSTVYGNWEKVEHLYDLKITDGDFSEGYKRLTLCHYPMLSWYESHKGSYQLFGHVHGKLENKDLSEDGWSLKGKISPRQLDVGADVWDCTPLSWEQIKSIIDDRIQAI